MRLVINLVTRGRPEILARTIETTLANITCDDTVLMVSVDEDDTATLTKLRWFSAPHVVVSVKPREDALGAKFNRMLEIKADLYCNQSDYCPFTSKGFDAKIIEAASLFPDGIGVVVNPMRNASFSDIYVMTRGLVDKLGFYFPPLFPYWFHDHWIDDTMRLLNRWVMADVAVSYDQSGKPMTQVMREPAWWATFFDCAYMLRRGAAHAIIDGEDFEEPALRKAATKTLAGGIEYRSRWINDQVRAQSRDLEWAGRGSPPTEGYMRARVAAANLVPQLIAGMPQDEAARWAGALLPPANVMNLPKISAG